jgi:hypothetical protein
MEPKLALVYNSQSGNGMLGMGWSLSGLSAITRCPRTRAQDGVMGSVNFDINDRYCLDGQRLILVAGTYGLAGSEYRTEIDSYSKITAFGTAGNGVAYFEVKTKSGLTMEYGNTADSRIEAIKAPGSIAAWPSTTVQVWAQNKVTDVRGNYLTVIYDEDSANGAYYPKRMDYTGNASAGGSLPSVNSVQFIPSNAARLDSYKTYHAGAFSNTTRRMSNIQIYRGSMLVKDYRLEYAPQTSMLMPSQIATVRECDSNSQCQLPVGLRYGQDSSITTAEVTSGPYHTLSSTGYGPNWSLAPVEVNGDGKTDMVAYHIGSGAGVHFRTFLSSGDGTYTAGTHSAPFTSGYGYGWSMTPMDVNGDGRTDLVAYYIGVNGGIRIQAFSLQWRWNLCR